MTAHQKQVHRTAVGLLLAFFSLISVHAADLEGAWRLLSYEAEGREHPGSGIMIFTDGHFAMLYTIGGEMTGSARSHAGSYRTEGDKLIFEVDWWIETISGKARVVPAVVAGARAESNGDTLVLRFDSGSVQRLRRLTGEDDSALTGAWRLKSYESRARTGPASGMILFSQGRFALVYTMEPAGSEKDGRAHAGSYRTSGNSLDLAVLFDLHLIDGQSSLNDRSTRRTASFLRVGQSLRIRYSGDAVQQFESVTAKSAESAPAAAGLLRASGTTPHWNGVLASMIVPRLSAGISKSKLQVEKAAAFPRRPRKQQSVSLRSSTKSHERSPSQSLREPSCSSWMLFPWE